eukprot:CAMPEP_0197416376 /NCGR_PEP_ID=MMETSP1170-20131217/2695_1 /TAXON_ID=54406 /ORGANISM="Sarcinochrysis sp, Strain CCMP770" /LENGTH=52 /DNA_ID=CAMNT_0042943267 /DNA_START=130 /DNA_END=288 /DNA_ORIENTATION=-
MSSSSSPGRRLVVVLDEDFGGDFDAKSSVLPRKRPWASFTARPGLPGRRNFD